MGTQRAQVAKNSPLSKEGGVQITVVHICAHHPPRLTLANLLNIFGIQCLIILKNDSLMCDICCSHDLYPVLSCLIGLFLLGNYNRDVSTIFCCIGISKISELRRDSIQFGLPPCCLESFPGLQRQLELLAAHVYNQAWQASHSIAVLAMHTECVATPFALLLHLYTGIIHGSHPRKAALAAAFLPRCPRPGANGTAFQVGLAYDFASQIRISPELVVILVQKKNDKAWGLGMVYFLHKPTSYSVVYYKVVVLKSLTLFGIRLWWNSWYIRLFSDVELVQQDC